MKTVSRRTEISVYGLGLFGATLSNLSALIVPLWLISLQANPIMIGLALGAFNLPPFLFSVHGGALLDRQGARRVMIAFAAAGVVVPFLFPALPWIWAVMGLQMIIGTTSTMGWIGAQALIGQAMRGSRVYAGRLAFVSVAGNMIGPPLAGLAWDFLGPWGGFGVLGLWGICQLLAALLLPRGIGEGRYDGPAASLSGAVNPAATTNRAGARPFGWRDVIPSRGSYAEAFSLLALPMVSFIVLLSMLRIGGHAIQGSFYVVYLDEVGLTATAIGALLATGAGMAAIGTLLAAPLTRWIQGGWLLLLCSLVSVVAIAVTPLLGVYLLFLVAQLVRGASVGLSTPLIITEMSAVVGDSQGKAVGLRTMSNRFMSMVTPVALGGLVAVAGLEASLLIGGLALCLMMAATGLWARLRGLI